MKCYSEQIADLALKKVGLGLAEHFLIKHFTQRLSRMSSTSLAITKVAMVWNLLKF